ncbi:MAG: ATP-binding cassette domain-containing protein [bacterium]
MKNQSILNRLLIALSSRGQKKEIIVLNDVSIAINKGETVGIIGENGSGKSTLLRIIAGIYKADKGDVFINGKIISLINLGVGLKERLTMKDNIFLMGSLLGMSNKNIIEKFDDIVLFSELEDFVDTKVYQFSAGMIQRLIFSIAINANPDILLLDEVFEVGDENFREKSAKKIKDLVNTKNVAVILVSHELEMIEKYCDRAILIKKGKIQKEGNSKEVVEFYRLNR